LHAAVRSSFIADRSHQIFLIKRRIDRWTIERSYEAKSIERIYVRNTIKGSGLAVRFKSGRTKDLTMSLSFETGLEDIAAALNHFLQTPSEDE
jgi:hypothetical protein